MNFVKVIVASSIVMSIFGCVVTSEVKETNKIASSPITRLYPVNSLISSEANKASLEQFVKDYVKYPRPESTAYGDYSRNCLKFPIHEVEKVNYVHFGKASDLFEENSTDLDNKIPHPYATWQMWFEMLYYHYCCKDNPNFCIETIEILDWKQKLIKKISVRRGVQPHPDSPFFPIYITTPGEQTRYTHQYLGIDDQLHTTTAASVLELNSSARLYAEYEYVLEGVSNELCASKAGIWNGEECIGTTIIQAEMSEIVDFYKDNEIIPTEGVENLIAEYLNTEISAIPRGCKLNCVNP